MEKSFAAFLLQFFCENNLRIFIPETKYEIDIFFFVENFKIFSFLLNTQCYLNKSLKST